MSPKKKKETKKEVAPKTRKRKPDTLIGGDLAEVNADPVLEEPTPAKKEPVSVSNTGCKVCGHVEAMHYGSSDRWCNTANCRCDRWQ